MSDIIIPQSHIRGQFDSVPLGTYGGDYSFAGAFLARAALGSSVICQNLSPSSQQNGAVLLDIIQKFGARVTRNGDAVNVKAEKLVGTTIDISEFCQIAPCVAMLALFAKGKTRIIGFKNSPELLDIIVYNLKALGARCEYNQNDVWIWPQKNTDYAVLDAKGGAHTALAFILISTYTKGNTIVRNIDGLLKRYPEFLNIFESLGGQYTLTNKTDLTLLQ